MRDTSSSLSSGTVPTFCPPLLDDVTGGGAGEKNVAQRFGFPVPLELGVGHSVFNGASGVSARWCVPHSTFSAERAGSGARSPRSQTVKH